MQFEKGDEAHAATTTDGLESEEISL